MKICQYIITFSKYISSNRKYILIDALILIHLNQVNGGRCLELNTIINQNCIEGMRNLDDNSVDLIIADPPYNLSKGGEWKWDNSVKLLWNGW